MIRALENIRHDDALYSPGELIKEIKKDDAERLVNLGVALFVELEEEKKEEDKESINFKEELDKKFKATDLKEIAEELEIEFPSNITKTDLIHLIIKLEKAEEALNFEVVEE